jgi:hypothetical protein
MTDYYQKQYDEKYSEFVDQILKLYPDQNTDVYKCVKQINSLDQQQKRDCGLKFAELINKSTTNKNQLLNRKIKLFSSKVNENKKISYSLLKFIPLKKLLNGNVTNQVKDIVWDYILLLYVFTELSSKDKGNIDKNLIKQILHSVNDSSKKNSDSSSSEINVKKKEIKKNESKSDKNILNLDCNKETNNMINDIVGMFQNNLENEDNDGNPFKNIVEVTKKITEQYQGKIENGDIDLDDLLKNIQGSMPNLPNLNLDGKSEDEIKHIIDENFSTADVNVGESKKDEKGGFDMSQMMGMMKNLNDTLGSGGEGMEGLSKMMESLGGMKMPENEEEAAEHSEKMRNILQKDFNMDLSELDTLKDELEGKGEGSDLDEKDFEKITNVMSNLLKGMDDGKNQVKK